MGKGDPDIPIPPIPDGNCDQLTFETVLNSVNEAILGELRVGTVLQVRRLIEQARPLAFCYWGQQQVGTVSGPQLADLLECLRAGSHFEGTIAILEDGLIRVVIRPA
jgi:hypothetical protein